MKKEKNKKKLTKYEKWFRFLHFFARHVYRPFFPYKRYGHTEMHDDRAYIFVGNHYSVLDVAPVALATTKPLHFMAKSSLFEKGFMKWFCTKCQAIKVNRDGTDYKAIMEAIRYLKNGEHLVIFPEGTRNKNKITDINGEIFLPFKSGATAISIKTKTPIIPVMQVKKLRFLRKARIYYGAPIEFTEYYDKRLTEEDIEKCDVLLREKMRELYIEFYNMLNFKKKSKQK